MKHTFLHRLEIAGCDVLVSRGWRPRTYDARITYETGTNPDNLREKTLEKHGLDLRHLFFLLRDWRTE